MKASEIYQAIDEMAPFSVHASYDNPGFLIGDQNAEVTKVLLALDITVPVVQEAAQLGAELIVSHHPVIFHPIRQLLAGSVCYELARSGISAICAHTNLDVAHEGVNDMLALTVGLSSPYEILFDSENLPLGRIGNLPASMELSTFAQQVKNRLNAAVVRFADAHRPAYRVAVIGGACDISDLDTAVKAGVDTLVTGDAKYHMFLQAAECGLNLIDAGHFATENGIVPALAKRLKERFDQVEFVVSSVHRDVVESV